MLPIRKVPCYAKIMRFLAATIALLAIGDAWTEGALARDTSWQGCGNNITDSLINPLEPGATQDDLTQQVARILHTVRMDGGQTVRWFVSDVWRQYSCSRDPENQQTGELDPAWYIISQTLLQQAQKEGITVVVAMADTANNSFVGLPAASDKRADITSKWAHNYRRQGGEDNGTPPPEPCEKIFQNGYFGQVTLKAIFESPGVVSHLSNRFFKMAEFLKQFPALAALEMFNEPAFTETEDPEFGHIIAQIRNSLYASDPMLRKIPIYSGVAWWDEKIAQGLLASGDLVSEPYATVHYYRKAGVDVGDVMAEVVKDIADVRQLAPGKQVIVAEAGSEAPIFDLHEHARFLNALIAGGEAGHAGMWFWGTYADDTTSKPDFRWEFNSTALSGGSFRNNLIATEREALYKSETSVQFTDENLRHDHAEPVIITQLSRDYGNILWRLRWAIRVGSEQFISVSRAGILLADASHPEARRAAPASVVAINSAKEKREWAAILKEGNDWRIGIYECEAGNSAIVHAPTPPYLISYAQSLGRSDFSTCKQSALISTGRL